MYGITKNNYKKNEEKFVFVKIALYIFPPTPYLESFQISPSPTPSEGRLVRFFSI